MPLFTYFDVLKSKQKPLAELSTKPKVTVVRYCLDAGVLHFQEVCLFCTYFSNHSNFLDVLVVHKCVVVTNLPSLRYKVITVGKTSDWNEGKLKIQGKRGLNVGRPASYITDLV